MGGEEEEGEEDEEEEEQPRCFQSRKKKISSFKSWHFDKKRLSAELQTTGWGRHCFTSQTREKEKREKQREHETFSQSEAHRGSTDILKWG